MRIVWAVCGVVALCLGALGALLPLLPTVPFMLLAAFCFARSSPELHHWLVSHPVFGPPILEWQHHGAISRRAKLLATVSIGAVFSLSLILGVRPLILGIQASVLCLVLLFIWSRPEGPRTARRTDDPADPKTDSAG